MANQSGLDLTALNELARKILPGSEVSLTRTTFILGLSARIRECATVKQAYVRVSLVMMALPVSDQYVPPIVTGVEHASLRSTLHLKLDVYIPNLGTL